MALTDAERAARLRRGVAALLGHEDARRARAIDDGSGGGSVLLLDRMAGVLPQGAAGTIPDESVVVNFPTYNFATNLEDLLAAIIADLTEGGATVTVEEADGSPTGLVTTIVFPNDSVTIDAATETATITFAGGAGGQYRSFVYELDGAGGFDFLVDADGHPMYELADLE